MVTGKSSDKKVNPKSRVFLSVKVKTNVVEQGAGSRAREGRAKGKVITVTVAKEA